MFSKNVILSLSLSFFPPLGLCITSKKIAKVGCGDLNDPTLDLLYHSTNVHTFFFSSGRTNNPRSGLIILYLSDFCFGVESAINVSETKE